MAACQTMTAPAPHQIQTDQVQGALLAAAVGDALGWPQEDRSGRVGGMRGVEPRAELVGWERRTGGRFAPHIEHIDAGSYSDDTQLLLAVARSRRRGPAWWDDWTQVELPFWRVYERGGGGATKRASDSWATGKAPWTEAVKDADRKRYFDAGGNGVAMRVLPHAIAGAAEASFEPTAQAILDDGIATHGHPRALVGALAYGFACWRALQRTSTLGYGELLEELVAAPRAWAVPPAPSAVPDWPRAATSTVPDYERVWRSTLDEMLDLLDACRRGISKAALSVDRRTLEEIGCFDKRVLGAGTVAAAASVFLASRYAAQPTQGLVAGAFACGADTDTIAAMAGGLLGAVNGRDWVNGFGRRLQDADYIAQVAKTLADAERPAEPRERWTEAKKRRLYAELRTLRVGDRIELPLGTCEIARSVEHDSTRPDNRIRSWILQSAEGQSLHVKLIDRIEIDQPPTQDPRPGTRRAEHEPTSEPRPRIGVVLKVSDMRRSCDFYRDVLGLEVTKTTPSYVSFAGMLALEAVDKSEQLKMPDDGGGLFAAPQAIALYIDPDALDGMHKRVTAARVPKSPIAEHHGRRVFRCADPDGHVIELAEVTPRTPERGFDARA